MIKAAVLHLTEIVEGPNQKIELFFRSMAQEALPGRLVGVILSGTGFNGAQEAEAIRQASGLVIVQQPASCAHPPCPKPLLNEGSLT